ncbi:PEP-CTERM sorting domain-containing protein [Microcystis aeruginosa CS-556/03]|nr:PEP-CTERM sorting domain-containing protein [Microcystis aeruginosa]MDB9417054.1 PEP-CTERM sorting domain-containing protein [Microcystis aeruginosa CS-556/03]
MVGTFSGEKSLKALSNKVFRFIQQTLLIGNVSTPEPSSIIGLGILDGGLVVRRLAKRR